MRSLPVPLTSLLGRERELGETERLLGTTRLLTLTGAGGSGKTRLALELARRAAERFDEVVWLDLAPLEDADLIPGQLLAALGLREVPDANDIDVVTAALEPRHALLVFDNCEHLVDACAALAQTILSRCPAVSILATTREALGITGEQTWLVPPLAEQDAMQLFAERARSVSPSFALTDENAKWVSRIVERLDGIPLAIELAAARVKVLPVEQIAQRLADAFSLLSSGPRALPRHRTIRETINWSFRLLSEDEQVLLRRLAVFSGTFSLEAAEAICDDVDVLGGVAALVDKSLLMVADDGYRLLETVRQFAAEKLESAREKEQFRERHARYFSQLVERAEPRLFAGAVDLQTIAMIDREIGNIRAVLEWAEESPERTELELRLIYALHWYWFARGHFHEARRRINAALGRLANAPNVDPLVKARAFIAHGDAAVWQADWESIRPHIDQSVEILRGSNDLRALSMALMLLGTAMAFADDADAQEVLDESVAVARRNGRDVALGLALYWKGVAAQQRGDLAAAREAFEEANEVGRGINNLPAIGHSLTVLGHLALQERKRDEAVRCFRDALEVHVQTDDRWGLTQVVEGIGIVLLDAGDAETGTRLLAAASAAWLQLGAKPGRNEEKDERIRQALANEKLRVFLASGAGLSYEAMIALARERVAGTPAASAAMLRVRALGPLEIELNGQLVDAGRSRELLLFLLAHPSGATKEQIGAALWPEVDAAKLRNNFHVTVHRLRKSLGGSDWVIVDGDTYLLKSGIDFDVARFERDAKSKDPGHLARAIELYRGDFFENATSDGEWYLDIRDRLRDLYARALSTLGRLSTAAGDHATAADVFQRLVALDEFDEEAARHLMTALAKQGDSAGAARVYKRLSDVLKKELDTQPEPATRKVFEGLRV